MKKLLTVVAAVVLTASLGACSDDSGDPATSAGSGSPESSGASDSTDTSGDDYCSLLEETRAGLNGLSAEQLNDEQFAETREQIQGLEDSASGQIAEDWATLGSSLDDLKAAVEAAGLSLADVPQLITGEVPNGTDPGQAQQVVTELQKIGTDPALQTAADEIATDAKKTCDVDLQDDGADTATPSN